MQIAVALNLTLLFWLLSTLPVLFRLEGIKAGYSNPHLPTSREEGGLGEETTCQTCQVFFQQWLLLRLPASRHSSIHAAVPAVCR